MHTHIAPSEKKAPPLPTKKEKSTSSQKPKAAVTEKKKTPTPKKEGTKISDHADTSQLLQSIAKSVTQVLEEVPEETKSLLVLPSQLPSKQDQPPAPYTEAVMQVLAYHLKLPEYGEVCADLTINSAGKVLSVTILHTKSVKNSTFLKNQLPELSFPCFNEFAIKEKELHFTITFRNAENF